MKETGMSVTKLVRRRTLLAAGAGVAATAALPLVAQAQAAWPSQPIKMVIPFGTAGSTDIVGRYIATKLSVRLGQPVLVENKVGAGGVLGTTYVMQQPADGYTVLFQASPFVTGPHMTKRATYDPTKDLQPVGMASTVPFMLVVRNDIKANNLRELIELGKTRQLSYGTPGIGTLNHLGVEMLAHQAGIKMLHVPYTSMSRTLTDFMGGNTDVVLAGIGSVLQYVQTGKMRAIAVTSPQRSPAAPTVPTMAEAALPGYQLDLWLAMLVANGVPAPIVKRLNEELNAVLAMPETVELLARDGGIPRPGTPEDLAKVLRREFPQWRTLIQDAKVPVD